MSSSGTLKGKLTQILYGPWEGGQGKNVLKLSMEGQAGDAHFWALSDWGQPSPAEVFLYLGRQIGKNGDQPVEISFAPDENGVANRITKCI